ncbi:WD repeat-containing protein dwa2 [Asimina triloba]
MECGGEKEEKNKNSGDREREMQGASTGIGYGLKYQAFLLPYNSHLPSISHLLLILLLSCFAFFLQARCIADVKADSHHTSFLAGTLSLKEENEVHLIRLSSPGTELICEALFSHPNEIWDLASCPFNHRIFSTVFASGETYGAALWEIPELDGQSGAPQLEQLVSLDAHTSKIKCEAMHEK